MVSVGNGAGFVMKLGELVVVVILRAVAVS